MKFWILPLSILLFVGCGASYDYVKINSAAEYELEKIFLESFFADNDELETLNLSFLREGDENTPGIFIDFFSSWEKEAAYGDIIISKTVLTPKAEVLAARTNTSFEACLNGKESLVPPEEIEPPFAALRVDGLALGDEGYPLVRVRGISFRLAENKKTSRKFLEKIDALKKMLENAPKTLVAAMPQPVWIAVGGDLMLDRGALDILLQDGPEGIFGDTAKMLASSDLARVNLEGVVSSRGEKIQKSFNFRFDPGIAPALRNAGIDVALHANNHVYDYGANAFLDSLSWLEKAGIGVVGAGRDDEAASAPFVLSCGGENFRIFGLASFPRERNGWDGVSAAAGQGRPGMLHSGRGGGEKLKAKIAAGEPSFTIVLFHGGVEWSTRPNASTRELYTGLVEAGADLIIGSHPHTVQGFEWVMGKPVFWSLGNYVFGGAENTEGGEEGLFLRLGILGGRMLYLEPFALSLTHTRTDIAPPEKLDTFYKRSHELQNTGEFR
jgi:poly-gamma-glutamate synthesis protein (capsule biosynthesis protein)